MAAVRVASSANGWPTVRRRPGQQPRTHVLPLTEASETIVKRGLERISGPATILSGLVPDMLSDAVHEISGAMVAVKEASVAF